MTWIKICGITSLEDANTAIEAGADALGFVFYKASPRHITASAVRKITDQLPQHIEKVGIFVADPIEVIVETATHAGLTAAQVYGTEDSPPLVKFQPTGGASDLKWIPAFSVNHFSSSDVSLCEHWKSGVMASLLDSGSAERPGGTGVPFDWHKLRETVALIVKSTPVIVAGGLTAENVSEAIGILNPWGVDVSSAVEMSPGRKDPEKIRRFIQAVRKTGK